MECQEEYPVGQPQTITPAYLWSDFHNPRRPGLVVYFVVSQIYGKQMYVKQRVIGGLVR